MNKNLLEQYKYLMENNSNWIIPDRDTLKREFHVEHELKHLNYFDNVNEFLEAVDNGRLETLTESEDYNIYYRSRTESKKELIDLLSGYRSWGTFRTEESVDNLYKRIKNDEEMDAPIVLEFENGDRRIFSGNTRLDIAYQLGKVPKVLVIDVNEESYE